jgi:hypothetical protein
MLRMLGKLFLFIVGCGTLLLVAALLGLFEPSASGMEGEKYTIGVLPLEPHPALSGLALEPMEAHIAHSESDGSNAFDFRFTGRVRFPDHDMRTLRLGVEFLDGAGNVVAEHYLWVTGSTLQVESLALLETVPAGVWVYLNAQQSWMANFNQDRPCRIASMRFKHDICDRLLPVQRTLADTLPVVWAGPKPKEMELKAQVLYRKNEAAEGGAVENFMSFTIENTGSAPCQELLIALQYIHQDGTLLKTYEIQSISLKNKPLQPGEKVFHAEQAYLNDSLDFEHAKVLVKMAN